MGLKLELRPATRIETELLDVLGEQIEEELGHHWVAYVVGAGWIVAGFALITAVVVTNGPIEPLLLVIPMVLRGLWLLLATYEDRFVVTDMRIFRIQGVLNQHTAAMSLSRIVDFTLAQPLLGQILGFGHFVFENAAQDQGLREIRDIPGAARVHKRIQQLVFEAGGGPAKHKAASFPSQGSGQARAQSASGDMDATGEIPAVP